jgi:hypothetical protein
MDRNRLVKVSFKLDPKTSGGWHGEHLWAERVGVDRFRLLNTPFHVYGFSFRDVVFAKRGRTGELFVTGVSLRGGHSTYWIEVTPRGEGTFADWWKRLKALGCAYEGTGHGGYAVDAPPEAEVDDVCAILAEGEAADVWQYEEAHRGHVRTRRDAPVLQGPEASQGRDPTRPTP